MTWIARYTCLRPDDVLNLTPWQFEEVCKQLETIIKAESGTGG